VEKTHRKSIFDDDYLDGDDFWICTKCKKIISRDQRHSVITVIGEKKNKPYHWYCFFYYIDKSIKRRKSEKTDNSRKRN